MHCIFVFDCKSEHMIVSIFLTIQYDHHIFKNMFPVRGQDKAHKITTILNKDRNVRKPFLHATVNQKQTRKKTPALSFLSNMQNSCHLCLITQLRIQKYAIHACTWMRQNIGVMFAGSCWVVAKKTKYTQHCYNSFKI